MKRRQGGAALLLAMLTVTLVATFAAAAMWQQWRSAEIEGADRTRVQTTWILNGALNWARLILREDSPSVDHLAEPWAIPLQEARLTTFLAADQMNNADTGEADNVFLSGSITDLQSRLNVMTLVRAGSVQSDAVDSFRRLFQVLRLPPNQLDVLVQNLRFSGDISTQNLSAARASLMPQRVEQLAWLGVPPETLAALEPYITVLPDANTVVNLNTASAEVIYAAFRNISLADAQRLVAARDSKHFTTFDDAKALLPANATMPGATLGNSAVNSSFFEVIGRLRMDTLVLEERSVLQRVNRDVRILQRERGTFDVAAPAR